MIGSGYTGIPNLRSTNNGIRLAVQIIRSCNAEELRNRSCDRRHHTNKE